MRIFLFHDCVLCRDSPSSYCLFMHSTGLSLTKIELLANRLLVLENNYQIDRMLHATVLILKLVQIFTFSVCISVGLRVRHIVLAHGDGVHSTILVHRQEGGRLRRRTALGPGEVAGFDHRHRCGHKRRDRCRRRCRRQCRYRALWLPAASSAINRGAGVLGRISFNSRCLFLRYFLRTSSNLALRCLLSSK